MTASSFPRCVSSSSRPTASYLYTLLNRNLPSGPKTTPLTNRPASDLINDFAARLSVGISRGRDSFMLRIVELINGARAVGIQRDRHSNSVVCAGRWRLRDDRQSRRQSDREK